MSVRLCRLQPHKILVSFFIFPLQLELPELLLHHHHHLKTKPHLDLRPLWVKIRSSYFHID